MTVSLALWTSCDLDPFSKSQDSQREGASRQFCFTECELHCFSVKHKCMLFLLLLRDYMRIIIILFGGGWLAGVVSLIIYLIPSSLK